MFRDFLSRRSVVFLLIFAAGIRNHVAVSDETNRPTAMTTTRRAEIDKMALHLTGLDSTVGDNRSKTVNKLLVLQKIYGNGVGWLVGQTPMPTDEEVKRARILQNEVIRKSHVVETPKSAQRVFDRLIGKLPDRMKRHSAPFTLTVLDSEKPEMFGIGAGIIYVTNSYLATFSRDGIFSEEALAFVLAHEIGHDCRGHCRSAWKLIWLHDEMKSNGHSAAQIAMLGRIANRAIKRTDGGTRFLYSTQQVQQADLFAMHLCRNAGFDTNRCLDALRFGVSDKLGTGRDETADGPSQSIQSQLFRLRQLLWERNGHVAANEFGLFEFEPKDASLVKANARPLRRNESAVVFLHGMASELSSQDAVLPSLAGIERKSPVRVFGFQYPNHQSLARSGIFLKHEIERVFQDAGRVDFVCHSAGGLVFRYYAEIESGKFRNAVFLGTPHGGSDLAKLRPLLEARRLLKSVKFGTPSALEKAIIDASGQISFDVQPDSLFLRFLNRDAPLELRKRYWVIRGKAVKKRYGVLMLIGTSSLKKYLRDKISESDGSELTRDCGIAWVDRLNVPIEVLAGDLAVSLQSAKLSGVAETVTLPINHMELTDDPKALAKVIEFLSD